MAEEHAAGGAAGPFAFSVGLRTRGYHLAGRPATLRGKTPGREGVSKWVQSRGWVIGGISLQGGTKIVFGKWDGKGKLKGGKAWETVPATRYESASGGIGTAGVLIAQSHVGITCYPINNYSPIAIFTVQP